MEDGEEERDEAVEADVDNEYEGEADWETEKAIMMEDRERRKCCCFQFLTSPRTTCYIYDVITSQIGNPQPECRRAEVEFGGGRMRG